MKAPSFVIIGAQKCGTTSLYDYLCQHPLVLKTKRQETHYLDWRYNHELGEDAEKQYEFYMNYYQTERMKEISALISGETSPTYLLYSNVVIPRMKLICPWAKLIVMLRNPVDRAFSQYKMLNDPVHQKIIATFTTPEFLLENGLTFEKARVPGVDIVFASRSFEEVIEDEITALEQAGITPNCSSEHFKHNFLEKLSMADAGEHDIVSRGLYALQLTEWLREWPLDQLKIMSINDLKGDKSKVQQVVSDVFTYIGIPPVEIEDTEAKHVRNYERLKPETRERLESFYKPYNDALFQLIGKELVW